MSGIVGIINLDGAPIDRDLLQRMTGFMTLRGPDAQKIWIDGNVGFGHTMFRTTWEAETEKQPLTLDGKVWLIADARIDGRAELVAELEAKLGRRMRVDAPENGTRAERLPNDAELILLAYEAWGEDCVAHLIGDFAFAIWDSQQRLLFCTRDHFGVKPFYYSFVGSTFVFSNTLNCVRLHPSVSDDLNDLTIASFLTFANNQDLSSTIFNDIQRLAPAHRLRLDTKLLTERYWRPVALESVRYKRTNDYIAHFKELFDTAVSDRMRITPIGVSMSGGLDSSSVAAAACGELNRTGKRESLRAFTMVYDEVIPDSERYYSGLVARHLGIQIDYQSVDNYTLFERWDLPELFPPEPIYFPLSAIQFDHLHRISRYSRVNLTGDGGDLMLAPSRGALSHAVKRFRFFSLMRTITKHFHKYRRFPALGFRTTLKRWFRYAPASTPCYPCWLNRDLADRLGATGGGSDCHSHETRPEVVEGLLDASWPDIFEQQDPGFTGIKLERRNPFFDLRLINYLLAIPPIPWCVDKEILRSTATGVLPDEIRIRKKSPLPGSQLNRMWEFGWREHFDAMPSLSSYVELDKFLACSPEKNIETRWQNMLPVALNYWLRNVSVATTAFKEGNLHEYAGR